MAKVFLDANIIIDLIEKRQVLSLDDLTGNEVYFSPLSIHILAYLFKYKMPEDGLLEALENYIAVSFDESVLQKALEGQTNDFEDNVQLQSADKAGCEVFLTYDKALLKMSRFGQCKIIDRVPTKD